jgi:hypothetical protein
LAPRYEGNWSAGLMHGRGTIFFRDGSTKAVVV